MRLCRIFTISLVTALAGCAGQQSALDPAGEVASKLFSYLQLSLWVCGIAYALVLGFIGWSLWRSRAQLGLAPQIEPENPGMRRTLFGWSAFIVIGLIVLVVGSFVVDRTLAAARTRDAMLVRVTGHQWWWRVQYLDRTTGRWIESANELHLPAGRTTRISLGAADVIHSFWVPNVAGKMDMIPGRRNFIDATPHRVGWFRGQCAEFCGTQHARMALDVKVERPGEFDAWLARQAQPATVTAAARGAQLVTQGQCAACHTVRGTAARGEAGPDLTHFASRRSIAAGTLPMSRGALQGWIAQPQALKPGTMMPAIALAPSDADAVATYLQGLQ